MMNKMVKRFYTTIEFSNGENSIGEGEDLFIGNVIAKNDNTGINRVIVDEDSNQVAILTNIDFWSKKSYEYTVLLCDSVDFIYMYAEEIDSCKVNTKGVINCFSNAIAKLIEDNKGVEVDNLSIPSAPNTSTMRASVSGKLKLGSNFKIYGDYYSSNYYVYEALRIGGGIDREIANIIKAESLIYSFLAELKLTEIFTVNKSGTNFNTVGLGLNT